ncbi:type I restriction endonuclease subunit R [Thioalkalivibrio sp. HK1]|uniref:type I restriction endonuclease subunit R n=1 Tax=Thioalkalivibrio sp. HK1 TaxID=1469245 RepID=UPI00046F8399|nr:HsdR family type I site-specific deoxyribonuclease [Thioalkalivibrio sp. HK1]
MNTAASIVSRLRFDALLTLIKSGYQYLPKEIVFGQRDEYLHNVLLEDILVAQLTRINHIEHLGLIVPFKDANIIDAVSKLRSIRDDGLNQTNERVYNWLVNGTSVEQTIGNQIQHHSLKYIDWLEPENNIYHIASEFPIASTLISHISHPDIVLFVNGIPFCVIKCVPSGDHIDQGIAQILQDQDRKHLPHLFRYIQLLLVFSPDKAKYATVGTPFAHWKEWREMDYSKSNIIKALEMPLSKDQSDLLSGDYQECVTASSGKAGIENHDSGITSLYCLCKPDRLLDLTRRFIVFENHVKKIARYHQYFLICRALHRIKTERDGEGRRKGGVVWHTQGSGKSLTMVMLTRALALTDGIKNARIVVITDRSDLDNQLGNTLESCGIDRTPATSKRDLIRHIKSRRSVITTLIHKFAVGDMPKGMIDTSDDIFVLVDESHRTQYGNIAAQMRKILPQACYIGFSGTPLQKKEKNTFLTFGGLIEPSYTIKQAIEDGAIVPLIHEVRNMEITQNKKLIDEKFDLYTKDIPEEKRVEIKRKYSNIETINQSDRIIEQRCLDISRHFLDNWKGTGYKAQLVVPEKRSAIKYHYYLNKIGDVTSDIVMSPPGAYNRYGDLDEDPDDFVIDYWRKTITESPDEHNRSVVEKFKFASDPEIIIVVDMLLTGFNAPRNTVLYLCRRIKDHTLLQAISRVNRLCDEEGTNPRPKEFGYIIDYDNVLGDLDKTVMHYEALNGFSQADVEDTLIPVEEKIKTLPRVYERLLELFKNIPDSSDMEEYERLLKDDDIKRIFHDVLKEFRKILKIALSTKKFILDTDPKTIEKYREDLRFFENLKDSISYRYAERIDATRYDFLMRQLLNEGIDASSIEDPDGYLDRIESGDHRSLEVKEEHFDAYRPCEKRSAASYADEKAHLLKIIAQEYWMEDPALYQSLSERIDDAIDQFHRRRGFDGEEYLNRIDTVLALIAEDRRADFHPGIHSNPQARVFYKTVRSLLKTESAEPKALNDAAARISLASCEILDKYHKVNFWEDSIAQNSAIADIYRFLWSEFDHNEGIDITGQVEEIASAIMHIARYRNNP